MTPGILLPPPVRAAAQRLRAGLRGCDRGSGAAAVLIFALLFMALAAFVVDGGLSISKRERAADIAEQAARYAAQDLDVDALRNAPAGTAPQINVADCAARVQAYIAQINVDGNIEGRCSPDSTPQRVEVTIDLTYQPVLTGFFYDSDLTVHGTAAAEALTDDGN